MRQQTQQGSREEKVSIKSMTGYGYSEIERNGSLYRVEIKTLNSRFCDVNVKIPNALGGLEGRLISMVKERLVRGKIDLFVHYSASGAAEALPKLNLKVLSHYLNQLQVAKAVAGLSGAVDSTELMALMRLDDVFESTSLKGQSALDLHGASVQECVTLALSQVIDSRKREGEELGRALHELLQTLEVEIAAIAAIKSELQQQLFDNLKKRLENFLTQLAAAGQQIAKVAPEERLATELAILTDKSDITEELTRLAAHQKEFANLVNQGDDVGRKLDFLCQEMHREANTISNKVMHVRVAGHILNVKQGIERLRQQVQNIE
jgi:uncharacterized protein (TIGR00255 family)